MTHVFKPIGDPARGGDAAMAEIHDVIAKHVASGALKCIEVDGKPMILGEMTSPHGHLKAHPTDPGKDKHTPNPPGHSHPAGSYSYTLVDMP